MKKNIFFLLAGLVLLSCSTRKKQSDSAFMKGFFSYYNTLFNSKDALQTELNNRNKAHKDNFYAPYISLLTYTEQPLGADLGNNDAFSENGAAIGNPNQFEAPQKQGASILEISEAKALKAISQYSVLKNGVEKNKKMFDAHLLLAQSRLYQDKPLEGIEALNYIFTNMRKDKRLPLAKIYLGLAYAKLKDYYKANETFLALKNDKLNKNYSKLLSVYYSEMLLNSGKKEDAVAELDDAYSLNKNHKLRSRIAFLRGQILAGLNKKEEARESFVTAYKNANDFEFEVKSQVEIAKTFNGGNDDYAGAKEYLEKISKKGTYASRKNEFYYALGLMANNAGKTDEAKEFFKKSLLEKVSDPQIRGLNYYEIGKGYMAENDYVAAGSYYDSALASMNYEPSKILLREQTENIKQISKNYYLIKKNDSILALTKMSDAEKTAYFNRFIDGIKAKEAIALAEQKKNERNKGFDTGDYSSSSIFASNSAADQFQDFATSGNKGFYFSNLNTVSKGEADFKRLWGNRASSDNWRTSARSATIEDLKNEAMGLPSVQNPRRLEPEFYIEKIPRDAGQILALKKDRDTASLGLGRMYETYFGNTSLATKTLYDLVDNKPEEDTKLQALYQVFAMNYEKNPAAAERAKAMILAEFTYTSYAEFVKNPKNASFSTSAPEVEKAYAEAFDLYQKEKFEESKALIEQSLLKYPKDALVPKFTLLNAFNSGKTAGKEVMILQLEQIALNYGKTPEGEKAKEMLKYLKSELSVELTDANGNQLSPPTKTAVAPSTEEIQPPANGGLPSPNNFDPKNKKGRNRNQTPASVSGDDPVEPQPGQK